MWVGVGCERERRKNGSEGFDLSYAVASTEMEKTLRRFVGQKLKLTLCRINMNCLSEMGVELKIEYIDLRFRGKVRAEVTSMEVICI